MSLPICFIVRHPPFVFRGHERRGKHEIRGGAIACNGNIPNHREAQQRFHIGIMRQRLQRIPKENKKLDIAFRDLRADLLITAQRPALQFDHFDIQLALQQLARGSGGINFVLRQVIAMSRPSVG